MAALDPCGCCDPGEPATPIEITNRPGLAAIAYRVGTFASFRETMLEQLAGELPELTTRAADDHAITLLELWAAVGDVLTFYQERIANEAFLRTAVHRDSVRMLADLLDYRPRPGLSAEVDVAFTLDEGAALTIKPGLRLMSLPGADELPQTFETLEPCAAVAALNRLQARPVPVADEPVTAGRTSARIEPGPGALVAGDRVVLFTASALVEMAVAKVVEADGVREVTWAGPLATTMAGAGARRVRRPLRFFGWNVPDAWNAYDPGIWNATTKTWDVPPGWKTFSTGSTALPQRLEPSGPWHWPLDGKVEGLVIGATLLVEHDGAVDVATVTWVGERRLAIGPLEETVTIVRLSATFTVLDRRSARVVEVDPHALVLRRWTYPAQIVGGRITVSPIPATLPEPKRRILLQARDGTVHGATVTGASALASPTQHLAIDFTPALPAPIDASGAFLLGNVARAGNGETQMEEHLGDGDGAVPFQSFVLSKAPVSRRPSAKDVLGTAELRVLVDGVRWTEVPSLYGQRPDARVYTLREEADGKTRVVFGDGRTGARLPSGRGNVKVQYRKDLGIAGNVKAGQLSILLSRPPGLRDAINPAAAGSGADPDPLDSARANAPTSVRTFGRIVAIEDFAWLATSSGEIAKAKATWVWRGLDRIVHLTVAAQGGVDLSAMALARLKASLDAVRDPNHVLVVANALRVAVRVAAKLVVEADRERDAVLAAARAALLERLSFDAGELGRSLHASQLIAALQAVPGVAGVDLDVLHYRDVALSDTAALAARGATSAPDQPHLRIFDARPPKAAAGDPIAASVIAAGAEVVPAEIATLGDSDLVLIAAGGVA